MKCKDLEMKDSETKVDNTLFKVDVPNSETRHEKEGEAPISNSI